MYNVSNVPVRSPLCSYLYTAEQRFTQQRRIYRAEYNGNSNNQRIDKH